MGIPVAATCDWEVEKRKEEKEATRRGENAIVQHHELSVVEVALHFLHCRYDLFLWHIWRVQLQAWQMIRTHYPALPKNSFMKQPGRSCSGGHHHFSQTGVVGRSALYWCSILVFHIGVPYWCSILVLYVGVLYWCSILVLYRVFFNRSYTKISLDWSCRPKIVLTSLTPKFSKCSNHSQILRLVLPKILSMDTFTVSG